MDGAKERTAKRFALLLRVVRQGGLVLNGSIISYYNPTEITNSVGKFWYYRNLPQSVLSQLSKPQGKDQSRVKFYTLGMVRISQHINTTWAPGYYIPIDQIGVVRWTEETVIAEAKTRQLNTKDLETALTQLEKPLQELVAQLKEAAGKGKEEVEKFLTAYTGNPGLLRRAIRLAQTETQKSK